MFELGLLIAGIVCCDLLGRLALLPLIVRRFEARPLFRTECYPGWTAGEPIAITSPEGLQLRGEISPAVAECRGLIVFVPEFLGDFRSASHYCCALQAAGYRVLSVDPANQGDSDRRAGYEPMQWMTSYESRDLQAALDWIQAQAELRTLPLGIVGISRGGAMGLLAAARNPEVQAVFCEGAFTSLALATYFTRRWAMVYLPLWLCVLIPEWHYRWSVWLAIQVSGWRRRCRFEMLEPELPKLRSRHVMLVSGTRDNYVQPALALQLAERIGGTATTVWVVPDAKHNLARQLVPSAYDAQIVAFFENAFLLSDSRLPQSKLARRERLPA